ncbi:MAG: hypothetical protein V1493_03835, partial [Candidatus Diapherotrites archaeon]
PLTRARAETDSFNVRGIAQLLERKVMVESKRNWPALRRWTQHAGLPPRKEQLRKRGFTHLTRSDEPLWGNVVPIGYNVSHKTGMTYLKRKIVDDVFKGRGIRKPR